MPQRTLVEPSKRMLVLEEEDEAVTALLRCLRGPLYIPHIRCCMRLFELRCLHAVVTSSQPVLSPNSGRLRPFNQTMLRDLIFKMLNIHHPSVYARGVGSR